MLCKLGQKGGRVLLTEDRWPFLIALVYAVFKKIESTRIIADEERPLLGNAIQSPDVVG